MPPEREERDQQPARTQQFEGQAVDVLVAARGFFGLGGGGGEFGRVEDNQIPRTVLVAEFPQGGEDVRFQPVQPVGRQAVEMGVFAPQRQRASALVSTEDGCARLRQRCRVKPPV